MEYYFSTWPGRVCNPGAGSVGRGKLGFNGPAEQTCNSEIPHQLVLHILAAQRLLGLPMSEGLWLLGPVTKVLPCCTPAHSLFLCFHFLSFAPFSACSWLTPDLDSRGNYRTTWGAENQTRVSQMQGNICYSITSAHRGAFSIWNSLSRKEIGLKIGIMVYDLLFSQELPTTHLTPTLASCT